MFYLTLDGELTSVAIDTTRGFQAGPPQTLFKAPIQVSVQTEDYAVAPNGDRFLMALPVGGAPTASFTVITDWQSLIE